MAETLNIVFQNFWNFLGTIIIILTIGYSISLPMMWLFKLKQIRLNRSIWNHEN